MSKSSAKSYGDAEAPPRAGEELAFRVFSVSMTGICAAILLMIVIGDY